MQENNRVFIIIIFLSACQNVHNVTILINGITGKNVVVSIGFA